MSPKQRRMVEHAKNVAEIQKTIRFAQDMINKCNLERQRGLSGAGLKSLSIDRAIKHMERLVDRLSDALRRSDEYHNAGHPEEFENYDKIYRWHETANRQLEELKKSQRKKVNIFEFSYELIDAIKERVSLVDMIDELQIRKKRSGGNRYVIICPFHDEKTPSCMVYADEDKFHCFGCQAHGDSIDFYQLYNDIEFDEALARLCERLQIQIMDADQVEAVDEKIKTYQELLDNAKQLLEEENTNYAKELQNANYN